MIADLRRALFWRRAMLVLGVLLLVASLFAIEVLRRTYTGPAPAKWTTSDTIAASAGLLVAWRRSRSSRPAVPVVHA